MSVSSHRKAIECWTSNFRKVFTLWSGVETFHSFHCVVMIWLTASLTLDPENLRLLGSSEPFSKSKKEFNTQRFHVICCVYCANTLISCFAENKNHYCFCGSQTRPCTLGSKNLWKQTHFSPQCTSENLHNFVRNS